MSGRVKYGFVNLETMGPEAVENRAVVSAGQPWSSSRRRRQLFSVIDGRLVAVLESC
jgi:hypothetical protein